MALTFGKKTIGIERDTFDVLWRAALGLALFVLIMAALSIRVHAQQTNSSQLTVKSDKREGSKDLPFVAIADHIDHSVHTD